MILSDLENVLRKRMAQAGPMRLDHFMVEALGHPTLGYYTSRQPLGAAGDFVTSPEISPLFGELLGLWAAHTWSALGSPSILHFIEMGPGRGTLMADALRAIKRVAPNFHKVLQVHLIEMSPVLQEHQTMALKESEVSIHWHKSLETVPLSGPCLILANEFFDALPIRQFQRVHEGWTEIYVAPENLGKGFRLIIDPQPQPNIETLIPEGLRQAPFSSVVEISPQSWAIMHNMANRIINQKGAALVIDYGHVQSRLGATLQAVQNHQRVSALEEPGLRDLTAHVDFSALRRVAQETGATVYGPISQGQFLKNLGLEIRAQQVIKAQPDQKKDIEAAVHRLTSSTEMGTLFQVLGVSSGELPPLAGF